MSDYALGYAKAGFRVFPLHSVRDGACSCGRETCQSQGKHPRTKNGFKDATIEPETIQQWWQKWPDANIGIATGVAIGASEGLYVIDIDTAKGATVEPSAKCPNDFTGLLSESLSVRTGSGGYHIYLRYDLNLLLKNTQGDLGKCIDTRGQGGYVVAPPSSNVAGQYTWLNRCPVQPIPEDLLSILRHATSFRDYRKEQHHDQFSHPAQTGATQETSTRAAHVPPAVADGAAAQTSLASKGRNDFLMSVGGFYRKQGLDIAEIRFALLNANEEFFGHGRHPKGPLTLEELERTVFYTLAKKEAEEGIVQQVERRVRFRDDSYYENQPPREWLVENIVPLESVVLTFGVSGSGKSFLIMDWSMCIGAGIPWQGRKVRQGPVAYISAEGSAGLRARIKAWKTKHGYVGESGVKWFDETLVLHNAGNFNELLTAFEQDFAQPPVLVILDTLSRCSGGAEENSNTEMAKVIAAADALQQRFHCSILIVHHAGKDSNRGPRGASALIGNTETIIAVDRTDNGCRVSCFKQKDAAKFDAFSLKFETVQFGPEAGDTSVVLVADSEDSQPALRQSESVMLAALTNAGEGGMNYTEWKQAGIEAGLKKSTATKAITDLVQSGHAVKAGKKYLLRREGVNEEVEQSTDEAAD
jgi:hypothetical protein